MTTVQHVSYSIFPCLIQISEASLPFQCLFEGETLQPRRFFDSPSSSAFEVLNFFSIQLSVLLYQHTSYDYHV